MTATIDIAASGEREKGRVESFGGRHMHIYKVI